MGELFERAKAVGLQSLKEWLPGGRQDGDEYICLNPTRNDHKLGSFRINTVTGLWSDFSVGESGADAISLYAYLFRDKLEPLAENYKNVEGGIQAEAAKEILSIYDLNYYPSANDDFTPPKIKKDFWEGYLQCLRGIESPPEPDDSIAWMAKTLESEEAGKWAFLDERMRTLFYVVRFMKDGKKDDWPFSLWHKGKDYKWRCKGFSEACKKGFKIPLYNRPQFDIDQNLPILMVEGQKNAQHATEILAEDFICTTEYGGLKNADLDPLRGRTVYRWIDPDTAGRKKLKEFKDLIKDFDVTLHVIKSPVRKEKGWDISDAIAEGWKREQLIEHIETEETTDPTAGFVDTNEAFDFKIIGKTNDSIWFFSKTHLMAVSHKRSGIGKGALMDVMDRDKWGEMFEDHRGGIAWECATNFILRQADRAPLFDYKLIRGAGAWRDNGRFVINCGDKLIVDGQECGLYDFESEYVYEKRKKVPYSINEKFTAAQAGELIKYLGQIDFQFSVDKYLLAGWILLAPFGGVLEWRPKLWLTGAKGSGKSTVLDLFVSRICIKYFGHSAPGATSSEAAIRRQSGTNSVPALHDEMESVKNLRDTVENINKILLFYRVGASGYDNGIIKVGNDGSIQMWLSQCMALFASIGAVINSGADQSRTTIISLKTPDRSQVDQKQERFRKLEIEVKDLFTRSWAIGFNSRTLQIWNEVERCIKIMISICTQQLGLPRDGDQIGTLLAGAYMVDHDTAPIASAAKEWIDQFNLAGMDRGKQDKLDEELVIDEILSYRVEIAEPHNRYKMTIANLLIYWFIKNGVGFSADAFFTGRNDEITGKLEIVDYDLRIIKTTLEEHGVKPLLIDKQPFINIAKGHPKLKEMLSHTSWESNYIDFLKRLAYAAKDERGPGSFAGVGKRYIQIDVYKLLSEEPPF